MTTLPRAATSPELALLRSDNQSSRLYLTVHIPATVYSARLAAVPSSTDQVTSIAYNNGSGTHTNILADQTLYIGTSAGAYDLGMCRIRNLTGIGATSGIFAIAEESQINWSAGAYLTVKDEFAIWPRHIRLVGTTPYMDYDLAYSAQNQYCDSIPIMGPHRVLWLMGATVETTFDAADSWALNNTVAGYSWAVPGASATSGTTTATPTITYNAAGVYRVALTVTNSDGAAYTAYRYVFVVASPELQNSTGFVADNFISSDFTLDSLSGDYDTGGWSAAVTLYDNAALSAIRDRALVIIHTRDIFGASNSGVGFVGGAENILFEGWIAGETIKRNQDDLYGSVSFTVEGPQYWLGRIPAFPVGLKNSATAPSKWTRFQGLTAKATAWHLLHWRSTITRCTDVFALANTWAAARIEAPGAQTLWEQLKTIESTTVLAEPCADRYGRLHNQINQQLLNDTDRGAVPTVMTLTGADISGAVDIERAVADNASIVDMSGMSFNGTSATALFSLSPGRVFRQFGSAPEVVDKLVLYDQATTNVLCGRMAGWRNNEYPRVSAMLASNQRLIDIAPYQFYSYVVAAADTPRAIDKTFKLIPRRVSFEYSNAAGYLLARAEFENEATTELAITGDAPAEIPEDPIVVPPVEPPIPPVPIISSDAKVLWMVHSNAAADPSYAIIYEVLDDLNAPVYGVLEVPAEFNVDKLFFAHYGLGVLIVGAHATSTPADPLYSWAGGAANITLRCASPLTSPSWDLVYVNGISGVPPAPGSGVLATTADYPVGFTFDSAYGAYGQFQRTEFGFSASGHDGAAPNHQFLAVLSQGPAGWLYGITGDGIDYLVCSPNAVPLSVGYHHIGSALFTGFVGPMPDDWVDGRSTYYGNPGAGSTYYYGQPGVETAPARVYGLRRVAADGSLEVIALDLVSVGYPNGDPAPWSVDKVLDETQAGGTAPSTAPQWTNTLGSGDVLALNHAGYLYYKLGGAWGKASGTVPAKGLAHFLSRNGDGRILFVNAGVVTSGSVPAIATADVTDIASNPWIDLTGNMWSGANKIMQSGNLSIVDSFLSF